MKTETDTKKQTSDLVLRENQAKEDHYRNELSGYEIAVRIASVKMEALVDKFRAEAIIYGARIEADGLRFKSKANAIIGNFT